MSPLDQRSRRDDDVASDAVRPTQRVSKYPSALLAALFAFIALMGWAFASPVGASPDDNFHLTSTWCAQGIEEGRCETSARPDERMVPTNVALSSACFAFMPEHSGKCDFDPTAMMSTNHGNYNGLYPPVYYFTMSLFVGDNLETSVLLMRTFNALLAVSLISALFLLLDRKLRVPVIWGLILTVVPMGMFIIASVNPSGWAILSAATLWAALWGYFRAPTTARRVGLAVVALVSATIGAGSRGDSAMFVAFGAVLACILSFERSRKWIALALLPLAILGIGIAFYLSSGQVDSALTGKMMGDAPESIDLVGGFIRTLIEIQSLWVGNFGIQALGWGDTSMPAIVWVSSMTIFAGVCFWGLSRSMNPQKSLALALTALALVFVPAWVIVQNNVAVGAVVQPRYILPLMVIFAGLSLIGFRSPDLSLTRVQLWIVLLGLSAANCIALYKNLRRYLTGTDYSGISLDSNVEWWWSIPISPNILWVVGSVAFGLFLVVATQALSKRPAGTSLSSSV